MFVVQLNGFEYQNLKHNYNTGEFCTESVCYFTLALCKAQFNSPDNK